MKGSSLLRSGCRDPTWRRPAACRSAILRGVLAARASQCGPLRIRARRARRRGGSRRGARAPPWRGCSLRCSSRAAVLVVDAGSLHLRRVDRWSTAGFGGGSALGALAAAAALFATVVAFRFYGAAGTSRWPPAVLVLYLAAIFGPYQELLAARDSRPQGPFARSPPRPGSARPTPMGNARSRTPLLVVNVSASRSRFFPSSRCPCVFRSRRRALHAPAASAGGGRPWRT